MIMGRAITLAKLEVSARLGFLGRVWRARCVCPLAAPTPHFSRPLRGLGGACGCMVSIDYQVSEKLPGFLNPKLRAKLLTRKPTGECRVMSCSRLGSSQRQYFMELAARGEFGRCLAFSHHDVLQAVVAKHSFRRLDDFFKDNPCRRLIGRF